MKRLFLALIVIAASSVFISAQTKTASASNRTKEASASNRAVKSSAAYAELLLRKTELDSEIESLLDSYTEEFPKVKASRYELELIQKDLSKMMTQTDAANLTEALGKMLVKRAALNAELWMLRSKFGEEHPEVKRASRKVSTFDNAIKDLMP